jgi:glycosyltransferase involved in cell wall biosynthesis
VRVAFLVNDLQLSGGIGVVVQHARQLAIHHGFDVTLVLAREQDQPHWGYDELPHLHVTALSDAREERFDVAVATWWETMYSLFTLPAERYAYFVQSLEDRFYGAGRPEQIGAALTLDLPISFITEARWIADTLAALRPDAPCFYVRNGIDKATFASPASLSVRLRERPLHVLIEGDPAVWFKRVAAALHAAGAMHEPRHVTVVGGNRTGLANARADAVVGPLSHRDMAALYAETDVVLKLSSVEGMFGPPLEGFHMGATCVVTEVTGHDEYVEHGWNGLLCDWDDLRGTARLLDRLAVDRRELHFLRTNALATARAWPSWEQAGQFMALALQRIRDDPPPAPYTGAASLLADLRTHVEGLRGPLQERQELARKLARVERITRRPAVARLLRQRHRPYIRRSVRFVRRAWRRLRR